jgi:hypothetical protein
MATAYVLWNRSARAPVPGFFAASADATAHGTRLNKKLGTRTSDTYDVLTVTV